jgi:hypothetical protein
MIKRILQWTKECVCNSGKPNFDAIEFSANSSKIVIVCGKCHSMMCWWPISAEQIAPPLDEHRTKQKSLANPIRVS